MCAGPQHTARGDPKRLRLLTGVTAGGNSGQQAGHAGLELLLLFGLPGAAPPQPAQRQFASLRENTFCSPRLNSPRPQGRPVPRPGSWPQAEPILWARCPHTCPLRCCSPRTGGATVMLTNAACNRCTGEATPGCETRRPQQSSSGRRTSARSTSLDSRSALAPTYLPTAS